MKGYKTILFGALVAIGSTLIGYLETVKATIGQCATDAMTNETICALPDWVGIVIGVAIIGLRFITTTPALKK